MPKTLAFNYITKSAVEKNCLARQIIFDFDVALLYIMSMHVFITNLSIVVPKRDGAFEKQSVARNRQLWTARTSQMLTARTDCTGSQHFAQPTVQPVMQPRARHSRVPHCSLIGPHGCGCVNRTWVLLLPGATGYVPIGTPRRWATTPPFWVADYCLFPCTPPVHATHVQARNFVVGVLCVLVHIDRILCGCPVLLHFIMEHTCKNTLGLCG